MRKYYYLSFERRKQAEPKIVHTAFHSTIQQFLALLTMTNPPCCEIGLVPVIPRKLHRHIQLSHVHKVYAILSRTPEGPFLTNKADLHFALNPQPPGHKLPIFFSLSPNFFCQSFARPVSPQPALLFLPSNEIPPTFSLNLFF